jgi:hypothetical protein
VKLGIVSECWGDCGEEMVTAVDERGSVKKEIYVLSSPSHCISSHSNEMEIKNCLSGMEGG